MEKEIVYLKYRDTKYPAVSVYYRRKQGDLLLAESYRVTYVSTKMLDEILRREMNSKRKAVSKRASEMDSKIGFIVPEKVLLTLSLTELLNYLDERFPDFTFAIFKTE